jgi:glycosyltransferase involved in cell wall biosynthesis
MHTFSFIETSAGIGGGHRYFEDIMRIFKTESIICYNKETFEKAYIKKKFPKNKFIIFDSYSLGKQFSIKISYLDFFIKKIILFSVPFIFLLNIIRFYILLRFNNTKLVLSFNGGYPGSYSSLSLCVAAFLLNINNILFVLSTPQKRNKYYFIIQFFVDLIICKVVTKVVVNSKFQKKELVFRRNFDKKKILVIYNRTKIINKNISIINKRNYYIGIVSRLVESKGIDKLIRALHLLNTNLKFNFYLLIAGVGHDRSRLNKIVNENKLEKYVKFYNFVNENELRIFYKKFQFFIFPSNWEGFPYSILEAMSYGKVIISSNVGGISEAIRHNKDGILINNINEKKIFNVIKKIYLKPEYLKKLSNSAKFRCKKLFSQRLTMSNFKKKIKFNF